MTTMLAPVGRRALRPLSPRWVAVEDMSFNVAEGEIFGIIGPNGAGKTTAADCLTGRPGPDARQTDHRGWSPE